MSDLGFEPRFQILYFNSEYSLVSATHGCVVQKWKLDRGHDRHPEALPKISANTPQSMGRRDL